MLCKSIDLTFWLLHILIFSDVETNCESGRQRISVKTKVKHKGKVYEISLEPTPNNSQNMDEQDHDKGMSINSQSDQQTNTNESETHNSIETLSSTPSEGNDTVNPSPIAYQVNMKWVQCLKDSGHPVIHTDMLLGDVKKILENESLAYLSGDDYGVIFDLKDPEVHPIK
jgi:hypothetical protein